MKEDQVGEPFVGGSGFLLTQMLQAVGIRRRSCYITNVSKERPPGNDFRARYYEDKDGKYEKVELSELHRELRDELQAVGANITVALGEEALRALSGHRGIGKWRGSLLATPVGKVMPTYHPASVMRKYEQRRVVEADLRRVVGESGSPELTLPEHEVFLDPSFDCAFSLLNTLAVDRRPVAFDIETLGERVRCIALAWSASEALCVPFVSCKVRVREEGGGNGLIVPLPTDTPFHSHWSEEEERALLEQLRRILSDPRVSLIAQNFPFDAGLLEREFGLTCRGLQMDTMVAQHCCYCELPKSLDFLCSFYTRVPRYSDYDARSDLETWRYNCMDAMVTFEVAEALERELREVEGLSGVGRNET